MWWEYWDSFITINLLSAIDLIFGLLFNVYQLTKKKIIPIFVSVKSGNYKRSKKLKYFSI